MSDSAEKRSPCAESAPHPFVLERTENPHPEMLAGALRRRSAAMRPRSPDFYGPHVRAEWRGYLAAMCDATGETPEAIEAWMDRQEAQA